MALDKTGFAYYPVDSDKYSDIRIKRIKSKFSFEGLVLYDYLISEIFRVKGYYMEWNEDIAFLVGEELGIQEKTINEIIQFFCELKLFDKHLLIHKKVLSSDQIQLRYKEMSKRCKRKKTHIPEEINILPEESPDTPEENPKSPEESAQSKEKEREEKEKKINQNLNTTPIFPLKGDPDAFFKIFNFKKNYLFYISGIYEYLRSNKEYIQQLKKFHPLVDIRLSLEKAYKEHWQTEVYRKKMLKQKPEYICWKEIFNKMLNNKANKVWLPRGETN